MGVLSITLKGMQLIINIVTTLALGSWPKQGFAKVRTKSET
jgi:hypothetical protein